VGTADRVAAYHLVPFCNLVSFSHTPPPTDEKGKKAAWAVAWSALVIGVVMVLLSVVLPTWSAISP
jgi:hypothetical protein